MKDVKEILCESLGKDPESILGDYATDHEPATCDEEGFVDDLLVSKLDDNRVQIGYVVVDESPEDFWEGADQLGKLEVFRSESDRDAFMDAVSAEGKTAFVVDNYRHGQTHWSVQNTRPYPDRQFDVAPRGVYVVDDEVAKQYQGKHQDPKTLEEALIKDANGVLDSYSKWSNGEVYGVVTETWAYDPERNGFEQVEEDAYYGVIGHQDAVSALRDEIASPEVAEDRPEM